VAGTPGGQWQLIFKVQGASQESLVEALRPLVDAVLDAREIPGVG
jgi:hypothetical protein